MSKVFPIKVEPIEKETTHIVEWMIGNTCNFDCSFCPTEVKSGTKKFFDIEFYKSVIDKTITESHGKKLWFKLTGGEPTLYPKLLDLAKYIKSTGNFTYLITNGSRTFRYWKEVVQTNSFDIIAFTYHPEQTNQLNEMIRVLTLFSATPTVVSVNITCMPEYFDEALSAFNEFKTRSLAYLNLQQINDNVGMSKYTLKQQEILTKHSFMESDNFKLKIHSNIPLEYAYHSGRIRYSYANGTEKVDHAINFIKRGEDNFFGYDCSAGMSNIRIEYDTVQRAVCGVGEKWSVYDNELFAKTPVKCTQTTCPCTLDIILPKSINT